MLVVLDTNVLVSAFWSRDGAPASILALVQNRLLRPCYDYRVLTEYKEVLSRPKFSFAEWEVASVLAQIENDGLSVVPPPLDIPFIDEADRKFYEVSKQCGATLITGNLKHFPHDALVQSVPVFLASFKQNHP